MSESWKSVAGSYGDYEVSNLGRVRSNVNNAGLRRPAPMTLQPSINRFGYPVVKIRCGGRRKTVSIHRLVLEAFVGCKPRGLMACHNDGSKDNNRLDNLRWDTAEANQADRLCHGTEIRGVKHALAKLTDDEVRQIRRRASEKRRSLAAEYGVAKSLIDRVIHRRSWAHVE